MVKIVQNGEIFVLCRMFIKDGETNGDIKKCRKVVGSLKLVLVEKITLLFILLYESGSCVCPQKLQKYVECNSNRVVKMYM